MQPVEDKQTRRQLAEGGPRTSTALQGRQPTNHGWEAKKRTNARKQQKTELGEKPDLFFDRHVSWHSSARMNEGHREREGLKERLEGPRGQAWTMG